MDQITVCNVIIMHNYHQLCSCTEIYSNYLLSTKQQTDTVGELDFSFKERKRDVKN